MEDMVCYCHNCKRDVNHEVEEFHEGTDCWLEIEVKCSECGSKQTIKLHS